jgi:hypothetical protein
MTLLMGLRPIRLKNSATVGTGYCPHATVPRVHSARLPPGEPKGHNSELLYLASQSVRYHLPKYIDLILFCSTDI